MNILMYMYQTIDYTKKVAAFRGMHVSPAKHSYACGYQKSVTTGQTDAGQSYPNVLLCFAGDTKSSSLILRGCHDYNTHKLIK